MTPRPALTRTEIEHEASKFERSCCGQACCAENNIFWSFIAGADFALAALASQEQRRIVEAKIEALEELLRESMVSMRHDNDYRVRAVPQVSFLDKISRLRKEIA